MSHCCTQTLAICFHRYMDAYREGATGNTVLAKTREMKKSHRVPLMIDQQPRVSYDRKRGRRSWKVREGEQRGAAREMRWCLTRKALPLPAKCASIFSGLAIPDLGWLSLEKIAECMAGRLQVQTWQTGWLANFSLTRLWKIKGRRMLWWVAQWRRRSGGQFGERRGRKKWERGQRSETVRLSDWTTFIYVFGGAA